MVGAFISSTNLDFETLLPYLLIGGLIIFIIAKIRKSFKGKSSKEDNYDINENKKEIIINLAKYHMHHIYINKDLPFGKPEAMIKTVDMNDMLLMFLSDKLGRGQKEKDKKMKEIEEVKSILEKLKNNNQLNFPKESEFFEKIIKKL